MRRFTILMLLSLILVSCQSGPTEVTSPVVPEATLSRAPRPTFCTWAAPVSGADEISLGFLPVGSSWDGKWAIYGSGLQPFDCDGNPIRDDIEFRVYWRLADGRRMLVGIDRHPFTRPIRNDHDLNDTADGPCCEPDMGWQITNGGLWVWSFVIEGVKFPPFGFETGHSEYDDWIILDVELWSHGKVIATNISRLH